ncbi:MAG: ISLre2 family transposase, partial [Candidatus Bathyarchaeota archaeon]|nr:ISLre2 family transposase [Candidatus Bathyarchaeota archaeon]
MESIDELIVKLKSDVGKWEEEIFSWACSLAQEVAKALLEEIDDELMKEKDHSLRVECFKEHQVTTVFGNVTVKRRLYQDGNGKYRFLLDEKMGLDKGCHMSYRVKELATFVCSHLPFQRSEEILRTILPSGISHTTINRLFGRVVDPYLEAEEREIEEVYEGGVIPESKGKVVPYLFIEADGTSIALQREETRRAEVKAGVAYEGWKKVGKDRYRLTEKTVYTGIMDGERFWEAFSLALAKKYDLSRVGRVIVGGDGASWVKQGVELFGSIYELDKFHLKRALNQTLDKELAAETYRACIQGEVDKVDKLLIQAQQKAFGDQAKEISRLRGYLMQNAFGLRDYRLEVGDNGLRGLGAIEGNVDMLVANRMK